MTFLTAPRKPTPFADRFHLTTRIEREGRFFHVSTVDLRVPHNGGRYETMAFPCTSEGEVTSWAELAFARYETEEAARAGHEFVCAEFKAPPPELE